MHLFGILAVTLFSSVAATQLESDALTDKGFANLKAWVDKNGPPSPETCTLDKLTIRREWSNLTRSDKLNYIEAVQCLGTLPARTPRSIADGARSRYDDFVYTHISMTQWTHGNGNFLSWHRWFMWAYEQTLRNECGYKGYLPYYNWPLWADNPKLSPLLDGSDTSISGDGAYVAGRDASCIPNAQKCYVSQEPGMGGGCVESGPFTNWTVHLGPLQTLDSTVLRNPSPDGLGYNPRCLKRDINTRSSLETNDTFVSSLIKSCDTIACFQDTLQNPAPGRMGVHLGGHQTIAGDAGSDFYNSPSDPYFWFHHAQVDRLWWTWQNQDLENRRFTIAGTLTFLNQPPTRNASLDDEMTMGEWLGEGFVGNVTVRNASSTLAGPFCYVYE